MQKGRAAARPFSKATWTFLKARAVSAAALGEITTCPRDSRMTSPQFRLLPSPAVRACVISAMATRRWKREFR